MAEQKKKCFIIMPITTPEYFLDEYRDKAEHFKHVLNCLFIPAIHAAGYEPIPPIAKGSDLIQAEIIKSLEIADLVLCDMSCLNPNVFFEFGIRTALNHPVCVVKDEITKTVPFDTGILNHINYKSTLDPWELPQEIEKLTEHLRISADRSKKENTLWKYFGLRSEAQTYSGEVGTDSKLDYLTMQMDSLRQQIGNLGQSSGQSLKDGKLLFAPHEIFYSILKQMPEGARLHKITRTDENEHDLILIYGGELTTLDMARIRGFAYALYGMNLEFVKILGTEV